MIPYLIQKQGIKDKYIGHAASIYRTCRIYISDAQYLYIQRHRYIDAKRTGWKRSNRTCLKLHCLLWMRTSNVIIHNITCSRPQHYLFSAESSELFLLAGFQFSSNALFIGIPAERCLKQHSGRKFQPECRWTGSSRKTERLKEEKVFLWLSNVKK